MKLNHRNLRTIIVLMIVSFLVFSTAIFLLSHDAAAEASNAPNKIDQPQDKWLYNDAKNSGLFGEFDVNGSSVSGDFVKFDTSSENYRISNYGVNLNSWLFRLFGSEASFKNIFSSIEFSPSMDVKSTVAGSSFLSLEVNNSDLRIVNVYNDPGGHLKIKNLGSRSNISFKVDPELTIKKNESDPDVIDISSSNDLLGKINGAIIVKGGNSSVDNATKVINITQGPNGAIFFQIEPMFRSMDAPESEELFNASLGSSFAGEINIIGRRGAYYSSMFIDENPLSNKSVSYTTDSTVTMIYGGEVWGYFYFINIDNATISPKPNIVQINGSAVPEVNDLKTIVGCADNDSDRPAYCKVPFYCYMEGNIRYSTEYVVYLPPSNSSNNSLTISDHDPNWRSPYSSIALGSLSTHAILIMVPVAFLVIALHYVKQQRKKDRK